LWRRAQILSEGDLQEAVAREPDRLGHSKGECAE